MDMIHEIRRRHLVQKQTVSAIARDMGLSRPTVRKHLKTLEEEPRYEREQAASPKLDQLFAGWYGGLAVEAMALGKPVLVYIRSGRGRDAGCPTPPA